MTATLTIATSCPPEQGGAGNPQNTLVPRPWSEVYGNNQNTSFNATHSQYALEALRKWSAPIGPLSHSAPVVDPTTHVIWAATRDGQLVALNPDGSERLRKQLDQSIAGTPALRTVTDEVYVIGQQPTETGDFVSHIYLVAPDGALLQVSTDPLVTSASPKLWNNYLFVVSNGQLNVFAGVTLLAQSHNSCGSLVCGTGPFDDYLSGFTGCAFIFFCSFTPGTLPPGYPHFPTGPFEQPAVAIIDNPAIVGDASQPVVVMVTPKCAVAYRFDPSGSPPLQFLWEKELVEVDCDFEIIRATTPVALGDGSVVIGDQNGRVLNIDVLTGETRWQRKLKEPVQCPPVSNGIRQIYVVEKTHLATLDSDGTLMSEVPLVGIGRAAVVSLDFVYVATSEGLHTFNLLPEQGFVFNPIPSPNIGAFGMALGEDGTLYVLSPSGDDAAPNGSLLAYAPQGTVGLALAARPSVAWQAPPDGATILSAPSQDLTVTVAGPGGSAFDGDVTFTSDLDGVLCSEVSPIVETATCTTSKTLSLGTHVLTAFATTIGGGTTSAAITVQVTDTPPTVTITAPAANAVFQQGTAITFTAQVGDLDQASFAPDKIQWQSSIDGAIGTGLSFTKTLSLGTHTITATATDQSGTTGSASVSIQVTQGPVVTIQQPTEGAILFSGSPITFSATITDNTEAVFPASGIKWQSSIDGDLGTGASISHALSNGNHTITVTATDSHGFSGHASVQVTVQPPVQ